MNGSEPVCGVLYTATGPVYVEQALASIASLRRWNPSMGVAVFTDSPDAFQGKADFVGPASDEALPRRQRMLPRLQCLQQSPFARTLALDTDTIILGPLDDLFAVLDRVSVGICHGHQRGRRFTAAIRDGKASPEIPYGFAPVQGGVILFDDEHGREFVDDVVDLYQSKDYIDDQVSMREVLWNADYRFASLGPEYNIWELRVLEQWAASGFDVALPRIFHTVTLKNLLTPQEIDRALLPLAKAAQKREVAMASRAADIERVDGRRRAPSVRALRVQVKRWRRRRRLLSGT